MASKKFMKSIYLLINFADLKHMMTFFYTITGKRLNVKMSCGREAKQDGLWSALSPRVRGNNRESGTDVSRRGRRPEGKCICF